MTMNQEGYPVFKGLQKPLEFMGIRGRFLTLAAAAIGVSFVGFIGFSIALGKIAGFIAMMVMALVGLITIYIKQRGGLHNKKRARGNAHLFSYYGFDYRWKTRHRPAKSSNL